MISDCGNDQSCFLRRKTESVENAECHDASALAVTVSVDEISDIMKKTGDPSELRRPLRVAERFEDISRFFGDRGHVREAVLRISERFETVVGRFDVYSN